MRGLKVIKAKKAKKSYEHVHKFRHLLNLNVFGAIFDSKLKIIIKIGYLV